MSHPHESSDDAFGPEPDSLPSRLRRILNFASEIPANRFVSWVQGWLDMSGSRTWLHVSVWIAAAVMGVVAVAYARMIAILQGFFFKTFERFPLEVSVAGPVLFAVAVWTVRKFGPDAKGSGVPQVLVAIHDATIQTKEAAPWEHSLVSIRTAVVKILSSAVGILAGASIGREGPTIQIAAAGFAWFGQRLRKFAPQIEFRTFLTAGAAAGVAAAFNTPIAGITFAIEELGGDVFGLFRQMVMLAIIVSGIVAQGISGNYLYFGRPAVLNASIVSLVGEAVAIGLIGGLLGGLFAKSLAAPGWLQLPRHWLLRALLAGAICSAIGYWTHGDTAGSGYEVTQRALESGNLNGANPLFPLLKLTTTTLSYMSGMAGGIFSPSLSIGAGVGLAIAKLAGLANFKACALFGMVAFFSGAVRAPLTAVIIVMEMTDERALVIPFMIAAFLAYSAGRRVMAEPLYHHLARNYRQG